MDNKTTDIKYCIDRSTVNNVSGWCCGPDKLVKVRCIQGDQLLGICKKISQRPDIQRAYPNNPYSLNSGFSIDIDKNLIAYNSSRYAEFVFSNGDIHRSHKFYFVDNRFLYRTKGYKLLSGHGLEIGAFHSPAQIPVNCTVDYCDAHTREQAINLFPEVPSEEIINPKYICDLDKDGLQQFCNEQYNFVILNHLIEHVANPINVIAEILPILKYKGHAVIACPDKRFTFDKDRDLTPLSHLIEDFQKGVKTVSDEHYLDFLLKVHPGLQIMELPEAIRKEHLAGVRVRHEHAHVWDSESFKEFMNTSLSINSIKAKCVYEVSGDETHWEYFSVWEKPYLLLE